MAFFIVEFFTAITIYLLLFIIFILIIIIFIMRHNYKKKIKDLNKQLNITNKNMNKYKEAWGSYTIFIENLVKNKKYK